MPKIEVNQCQVCKNHDATEHEVVVTSGGKPIYQQKADWCPKCEERALGFIKKGFTPRKKGAETNGK